MRFLLFFTFFFIFLPIKLQAQFSSEKIISDNLGGANEVYAADLDYDGDMDLLCSSWHSHKITWHENNGNGHFQNEYVISTDTRSASSVYAADLDNDGFVDVLSASRLDNKIAWYKNDGNGNFGNQNIISVEANGARSVYAVDIDNDGDMDVFSASENDDKIAWYENDGNGNFGLQKIIFADTNGAYCVHASDLDGDGDIDALSAARNEIAWYENDGNGNFGNQKIISNLTNDSRQVYAADLDGDKDMDVLSASFKDDKVAWYENDGNGNFSSQKIISQNVIGATSVHAVDLDADTDLDVVSNSYTDNKVVWFENDGDGNFGNPNIMSANGSVGYVHASDLDSDEDMDLVISTPYNNQISWFKNLSKNTQITNFAFIDLNENGVHNTNEPPLLNQPISLAPFPEATFTNIEGYTRFFVKNGEYQLIYQPQTLWELTTTSETYNITVTNSSQLPIYYFGFKPTRILPRVEPHLNSSPTRCNTIANYWLDYSNTGTTVANGTVILEVDELMNLVKVNPTPDNIEGNRLTWHFSELAPSFENKIYLQFRIPDFNSMGEILQTQATVQVFNDNEELVSSKSTEYNSEVLCSYDPNDKLVRSNLLGQSKSAYISDTLLYTIRFQNTGNDVAFNIRVEDLLDKRLDWTTFHPITASHDYRTELNRETGLVTFYFDDIMLPDSTSYEPESHGFVLFGIASLAELEDKTEVENTASIFFDFNPPIVTNTVSTVLIEKMETDIQDSILEVDYSMSIYPNPFSDYTTIEVEGLPEGNYQLEIMDILGKKMETLTLEEGKVRLERGGLESGVYFFRVLEEGNLEVIGGGKVLVE